MKYKEAINILNSKMNDDLEAITKKYRDLLKKSHPDQGGTNEWFIAVRAAYKIILEQIKYQKKTWVDGEESTTEENLPQEVQDMLTNLIDKIIDELIVIQILGCWLWCSGNTYAYKKELKELGFKFSRNKSAWYWHNGEYKSRHRNKFSLDEIANLHGEINVEKKKQLLIAA